MISFQILLGFSPAPLQDRVLPKISHKPQPCYRDTSSFPSSDKDTEALEN